MRAFQMKLTFKWVEWVEWVKQVVFTPNVSGPRPVSWKSELNKKADHPPGKGVLPKGLKTGI